MSVTLVFLTLLNSVLAITSVSGNEYPQITMLFASPGTPTRVTTVTRTVKSLLLAYLELAE